MGVTMNRYTTALFKEMDRKSKMTRMQKFKEWIDKLVNPDKYSNYIFIELGTVKVRI